MSHPTLTPTLTPALTITPTLTPAPAPTLTLAPALALTPALAPPAPPIETAPAAPPSFWQRRIIQPILAQLTQGVTPDRLAMSFAIGTTCALFPFFGCTTLLSLGVGWALRLNQPLIQIINQLLTPVQLSLILIYVRLGEGLWQTAGHHFTVTEMLHVFREASVSDFFQRFGRAGVHAFSAWLLTAPVIVGVIYATTRPFLQRAQLPPRA